ncbi:MAG: tetratricopeptide repeat protein, partial [Verrucomicrobiota bacterium]
KIEEYLPISDDKIASLFDDPEMLQNIDAFLEAQTAIRQEYLEIFETGIEPGQENVVLALQKRATMLFSQHQEASKAMEEHEDNPIFQRYLDSKVESIYGFDSRYLPSIEVPDLVTLVGKERAEEILKKAFEGQVVLSINKAEATLRLARILALEHIDKLVVPQWALVKSIDQVELYEAMLSRFPPDETLENSYNYDYESAKGYYFWGLVAAARPQDAISFMESEPELFENMPYDVVRKLKSAGHGEAVWQFLDQLLPAYPSLDLWDEYFALSAELKRSERMLEVVRKTVESKAKGSEVEISQSLILASAFLAVNQVSDAVKILKDAIETKVDGSEQAEDRFDAAMRLAEIGYLLGNTEWLEAGLKGATLDQIEIVSEYGNAYSNSHITLIRFYQKIGRPEEAIALIDSLITDLETKASELVKESKRERSDTDFYFSSSHHKDIESIRLGNRRDYQSALTAKLGLLIEQKQYEAAEALLLESPFWLARDISEVLSITDASKKGYALGYLVAQLLHETDRSDQAATILEALLREKNGYDPAYELYTEIKGKAAIEYLDKLHTLDSFQERPLIWKAQLLINDGQIDEAEKVATAAISIDPSDGEQPKDDRMRVYDVMRQIRSAQDNHKEEKFFADVLKAIRLSEDADDYYSIGLYTEAIDRYLKSLNFFQDAYCIQSRVAVRLYDQGRIEEALTHYKKAYELMPSSFGRVESHCFGCESVFKGDEPQSIAETVFEELIKQEPENPQIFYLMGYLRDYQEREAEALEFFRKSVELDPNYLNAWKKILSLSNKMKFSQAERDELILKIYAMDPLGRHSSPDLAEIKDIKSMWRAVLRNRKVLSLIPEQDRIFTLEAAAKALPESNSSQKVIYNFDRDFDHPADVLKTNRVIEEIETLFVFLSEAV